VKCPLQGIIPHISYGIINAGGIPTMIMGKDRKGKHLKKNQRKAAILKKKNKK